jgi:hypothetical protein
MRFAYYAPPAKLLSARLPISISVDNSKAARDLRFHNRPIDVALSEIVTEEKKENTA